MRLKAYLLIALGVFTSLLVALSKAFTAGKDTVIAGQAKAAHKRSQDVSEALVEGEAKAAKEVADAKQNARSHRGHFSD